MPLRFGACCCISYSALVDKVPCREVFYELPGGTSLEEGFLLVGRFCFNLELTDEEWRLFTQAREMWSQGARQSCVYTYHINHSCMAFVMCLESRKNSRLLGNCPPTVVESCASHLLALLSVIHLKGAGLVSGTAEVPELCSLYESLSLLTTGTVDSRSELCVSSKDQRWKF